MYVLYSLFFSFAFLTQFRQLISCILSLIFVILIVCTICQNFPKRSTLFLLTFCLPCSTLLFVQRTYGKHAKRASGSAVEHLLAKEGVAGSIPVSRFFHAKVYALAFFIVRWAVVPVNSRRETYESQKLSSNFNIFHKIIFHNIFLSPNLLYNRTSFSNYTKGDIRYEQQKCK